MWSIIKVSDGAQYLLPCNKDIVVGRKDVDIPITGDSSVSRKHGVLNISHPIINLKNPDAIPTITVTDSSKFGTFLTRPGGEKIKANKKAILSSGDIIQFGAQHSIYKLQYTPLVVTSSMLENNVKQKLQETILRLGGHMVNSWHNAMTHMVLDKIKLSIKVTQALVNGCHIVTPDYVWKLNEMLGTTTENILNPEDYLPELSEPNLSEKFCSFKVDERRKTVFKDRTFIFLCKKQLKRLEWTISGGGGKNVLINDPIVDDTFLLCSTTGIVSCDINEESIIVNNAQYQHIQDILLINERRFIQEHEVGLAVLYCDASVYGNPSFDLNSQNTFTQRPMMKTESEVSEAQSPQASETTAPISGKRPRPEENERSPITDKILPISPEDNAASSKKTKVDHSSEVIREQAPSPQINRGVDDLVAVDNVADSCLDDDSLWSQNFDSASFVRQDPPIIRASKGTKVNDINLGPSEVKHNQDDGPKAIDENLDADVTECQTMGSSGVEVNPTPPRPFVQPCNSKQLQNNDPKSSRPFVQASNSNNSGHDEGIKREANHDFSASEQKHCLGYDPLLPMNLAVTDVISLIATRKQRTPDEPLVLSGMKNFKRFRKVWPTYMAEHMSHPDSESSHRFIPRIIGGSDFFVHEDRSIKSNDIGDWYGCESQNSEPFGKMSRARR